MTTERPKTSLFQYGLLILLAVIAVGVWLNRSSGSKEQAPALVTGENLRAESPFPNAPGGSRNVVLPELEQLADSIKQGDVKVIEPAWRNALMVRNSQYLIKLYRLICEHGNEEALAAIGTTMQPLSSQDVTEVLAGLTDLLDRKQYAGLLFVLDKKSTSIGLFMEHVKPWLIKEFQREPWEDQRFSAIIKAVKANRRPINYMPELITESLSGSAQRFEWTLHACDELTDNEIYAPIARIENTPNLINESNIQRVLQLGSKLKKRDLTLLFRLCLPYIKPEHAGLVREMMIKMQPTPELVDYVVTRDAGEIELWLRDDLRFSRAVFHKFEQSLRPADFREKAEQFASMATMFNRMATQSPDFDVFRLIIPQFVEQNEWLWSHGYRPTVDTPVVSCLYLAIRFKDMELFKQTLNRNKGDLWHVLNEGMLMPASSGDKSAPSQYVPLLVVITDWDLEAVKLLMASGAHDWNTWKHESPLLVATRQKKLDIYRHLVASGINWDQKDVGTASKLDDLDQTVRKDIRDEEQLAKRDSAYKVLIQAVADGDMAALEKVLERFPFRQEFGALPERLEQQLVMYDAMTTNWRRAPGIDEVMTRAVRHPQIFNRLLAEGFPVSPETLRNIVTGGHKEVLESVLCDMDVRKMVKTNLTLLQNAAQKQPELQNLLSDCGR